MSETHDVRVQVRLSGRLYTYAVRCEPGSPVPDRGDTVEIPAPWWAPGEGPQRAVIEHAGAQCVDTGYAGTLVLAALVEPDG